MKHFFVLFIACTLFPLIVQAQTTNDTIDINYTKEMLQGKLWELEIPEGVEVDGYANIEFKGDSLHQTYVYEGKKYVFPCVYYLSDSYQMYFDDEKICSNQAGKYIQVKYLDANCDGTGKIGTQSFRIKKLTDDTLELAEWKTQRNIERYHAKPITEQ